MRVTKASAMLLALLLGACGDDDGGAGPDGGGTADAAVTVDATRGNSDTAPSADSGSPEPDAQGDATTQSDASGQDALAEADAAPEPDGAPAAPTFTTIYDTILSTSCSPCHTSGSSGGLSMSNRDTAYDNLVDVAAASGSCSSTGLDRAASGDADNSLLVQKLRASPPCGARMPLGRSPLSTDQIELIEQWINAGAKDD
jgi:hypothetical protein